MFNMQNGNMRININNIYLLQYAYSEDKVDKFNILLFAYSEDKGLIYCILYLLIVFCICFLFYIFVNKVFCFC